MICAIPTLEKSSITFTLVTSLAGTACGFFLRPEFIPSWFSWLYYASFYKYAVDALYINQFAGVVFNGEDVLDSIFSVDPGLDLWGNVGVLFLYPVVFHALAYVASNRKKK
jgi:ABC-type multidrug transport system permease subunit